MAFGFRSQALAGIFVFAAVSSARPDNGRKESFADSFDAAGAAMWQPFPSAAKVEGAVATIAPPEGQQCLSDVEVAATPAGESRERLSLNLAPGSVACVSRLQRLLAVQRTAADTAAGRSRAQPQPAARGVRGQGHRPARRWTRSETERWKSGSKR